MFGPEEGEEEQEGEEQVVDEEEEEEFKFEYIVQISDSTYVRVQGHGMFIFQVSMNELGNE